MTEIILPNDTNTLGNLLGGRLMHFIDITGAMAAYRHSRTHVVTAAMEVGVKVYAENTRNGTIAHVASAYLVFVAINEAGQRQRVPQVMPETPDQLRRYEGAQRRREHREAEAARRKQAKLETMAAAAAATAAS